MEASVDATESDGLDASRSISGTRRAVGMGKYRLFARLGSGGQADVYLAVAQGAMNVNRLVVLKRLRDEHANDPTIREMFLDEARLAARLNHPNVIQTFEAGNENGSFFLAMEYVDGQPLSRLLTTMKREKRVLEPKLAARICADALSGLHYAHELQDFDGTALEIVHRDVSPQNIMLTYEGTVKLVDFGIAKAIGTTQTAQGVFKGKIAFMAPEQVRCENVDRRADLFAAGIVLWECVTGKLLMAESTPAATLYNLMTKDIPRASEANPNVPKVLDDIIERALRRDVSERFQTAKEMRDALEAFISLEGGVAREEIGGLLKTLFAEMRDKVQEQIKSQLTTLSLGRIGDSSRGVQSEPSLSGTQVRAMTRGLVELNEGFVEAPSHASLFKVITSGNRVSRTRRLAALAWFGVPLVALAASGVALMRSREAPTAQPAPTATTATTEVAASAPPTAPTVTHPMATALVVTTAPPPTATVAPVHIPAPPPVVRAAPFVPSRPVAPSLPASNTTPPPATADTSKAATSAAASSRPEVPQGRTFRRDL